MDTRIIIVLLAFLAPMVTADLGDFEKSKCVDVKTVLNATEVTLSTISYPNSTVAVSNETMTKMGNTFNYTFCSTDTLGVYIYDYCDQGDNCYVNSFEITYNGKKLSSADAMVYIIMVAMAGVFLAFLLYLYPKIPRNDNSNELGEIISINKLKHFRRPMLFLIWLLVTFIFYILSNISFAYLPDTLMANTFFTIFRIMMVLTLPLMILWSVKIFLDIIGDIKTNKILSMGGTVSGKEKL